MKVCGIVTEYNPFHNGHLKHIAESVKITDSDYVVAVMSGNFVQRGEPAIIDKFKRTEAALLCGVDMVIELPVFYATASAEFFASAAISLLNQTNIIDTLCFGSESGNINRLQETADILLHESPEFKSVLKSGLDKGLAYPVARAHAVSFVSNRTTEDMNEPNNILAVEYLKALKKLQSRIKPYTIKRQGAHYHSDELKENIASASAIRKYTNKENISAYISDISGVMPIESYELFSKEVLYNAYPHNLNHFSHILHYILKTLAKEDLQNIVDISEGLENRIINAAAKNYLIADIVSAVKTKRYSYTKIQRALLHIILDIKKSEFSNFNENGYSQYIRVLGFRKQSEILLKALHKQAALPVVTNLKNTNNLPNPAKNMLRKEMQSTDLYWLGLKPQNVQPRPSASSQMIIV